MENVSQICFMQIRELDMLIQKYSVRQVAKIVDFQGSG